MPASPQKISASNPRTPSQDLKVTLVVAVENHNMIAWDGFCETSQVPEFEQWPKDNRLPIDNEFRKDFGA